MKKKLTLRTALSAVTILCIYALTSCEKHEGVDYFKSKCTAELNGQTYIDQTPFRYALSPVAEKTPWFKYSPYTAVFRSELGISRESNPLYRVDIHLFVNTPEEFLHTEQTIEKREIEDSDTRPTDWDYVLYCEKTKVSYATVNGEPVNRGTFRIISFDQAKGRYRGTFTLSFSEGILTGTLWIE